MLYLVPGDRIREGIGILEPTSISTTLFSHLRVGVEAPRLVMYLAINGMRGA